MDTLSLYYFSEAAKDLHFTKTANRLYISQQTLSNHIMRLEDDFGVKLFNRKPNLTLTYAGENILTFAEKINRESANLKDLISEIEDENCGAILFGASILRMSTLLPDILPIFSSVYPNVEIRIFDGYSDQLENSVICGDLNLAVYIPKEKNDKLNSISLMNDQIYLCIKDSLIEKYIDKDVASFKEKAKQNLDLKSFAEVPFFMITNRIGTKVDRCFKEAGFEPKIYGSGAYIKVCENISFTGLAATFATHTSLHNLRGTVPNDVNFFPLYYKGEPLKEQVNLISHKERYLCKYNQYFADLVLDYFSKLEQLPIESLVSDGLKDYYHPTQ